MLYKYFCTRWIPKSKEWALNWRGSTKAVVGSFERRFNINRKDEWGALVCVSLGVHVLKQAFNIIHLLRVLSLFFSRSRFSVGAPPSLSPLDSLNSSVSVASSSRTDLELSTTILHPASSIQLASSSRVSLAYAYIPQAFSFLSAMSSLLYSSFLSFSFSFLLWPDKCAYNPPCASLSCWEKTRCVHINAKWLKE